MELYKYYERIYYSSYEDERDRPAHRCPERAAF